MLHQSFSTLDGNSNKKLIRSSLVSDYLLLSSPLELSLKNTSKILVSIIELPIPNNYMDENFQHSA